jgi:hypothetical protein
VGLRVGGWRGKGDGFGGEGGAEEAEGAGVLFLDGADGDAETVGDFAVGKEFDFAQEEDRAATGWKFGDGGFEQGEFLAGHDLLFDARRGGRGGIEIGRARVNGETLRRLSRLMARRRAVT